MTQPNAGGDYPLVGKVIAGKYNIVRLLGEGGMGCVYLGEQQLGTTTRKVAVKTLHNHLSHDASIKARFQREVGTVAALEHPNTIQVFDFGAMEDGTLYIVMEFVQGRSVADILEKDGAMQPARVENILRQVVGSLEEAHNHGIVHRDLKPDNVVLCERAGQKDWVEVLDFGIAKRSTEHDPNEAKLTQQGMVLGTPPYMSPEQFTGQPIDVRSDIYALGVMAYEMLTGALPWNANTAWEWASKHMTEQPYPLERQPLGPGVPEKMRAAITRALEKDKNARFNTVREFYDAFAGGGAPISGVNAGGPPMAPQQGTAMMTGGPPMSGQNSFAPSDPGMGRAKTEMGTPMMGPAAHGMTPAPFPSTPMGGPMGPMGGAGIPPAPSYHQGGGGQQQKKGNGLIIGLGVFALLLIGGAAVFALAGKSKTPVAVTPVDLGSTPSATVTVASGDPNPNATVTAASPLDTSGATKVPPPLNTGGATTKPTAAASSAKPAASPPAVPTPTPNNPTPPANKPEPAVCKQLRDMRTKPAASKALIASLEEKCKKAME